MPTYATTRLTLTGPHTDLTRFQHECIRLLLDDNIRTTSLDLEVLVPVPAEIAATLDDDSDEAQRVALASTGHKDWHDWSDANWGTDQNIGLLEGRIVDGAIYDCVFETSWPSPEPALRALAVRYPSLSGTVVVSDLSECWSTIGTIQSGTYTCTTFDCHPHVERLVFAGHRQEERLSEDSARALIGIFTNASCEPAAYNGRFVPTRLRMIFAALAHRGHHRLSQWLDFEREAVSVVDLLNSGKSVRDIQESHQSPDPETGNMAFLLANDRIRTELDRHLLLAISACLREKALVGCVNRVSECEYMPFIKERVLSDYDEDDLREWAAVAMYRPGIQIDMSDVEALEQSLCDYANNLLTDLLAHLGDRSSDISTCPH